MANESASDTNGKQWVKLADACAMFADETGMEMSRHMLLTWATQRGYAKQFVSNSRWYVDREGVRVLVDDWKNDV